MRSFLALVTLSLSVCSQSRTSENEPVVFRHFTPVVPWTLDPALENHANVLKFQAQLFEPPLEMGLDSKGRVKIQVGICELPKIGDGGRSLKLKVRPGVRFHDDPCFAGGKGREVTPSDIKYMLMRHADPDVPSRYFAAFVAGRFTGLDAWRERSASEGFADYDAAVAGLEVDEDTITLGLTAPYPQLYSLLTQPWASIVPKEAIARYGSGFGQRPIGTGPFMFKSKDALGTITMVKNPTYRIRGRPLIDELRFEHVPTLEARTARFHNGDLHILDVWSQNQDSLFDRFGKVRSRFSKVGIRAARGTEMEISYFVFNCKNTFLGQAKIRHAIRLALDRRAFVRAAEGRTYKLADLPFPSAFPESTLFDRQRLAGLGKLDRKAARRLLAEAGHPGGKGLPEFVVDLPGHLGDKEKAAFKILKRDLALVGLKVQMRASPFEEFMQRAKSGDLQIGWVRWYADYPDVENFLILFRHAGDPAANGNHGAYVSPEYDRLYERMAKMYPGAARDVLIKQMVAIVHRDCPWLMLYYSRADRLVAKGVTGYRYNVMNLSMRDVGLVPK